MSWTWDFRGFLKNVPDQVIIDRTGMDQLPLIVDLLSQKYRGNVELVDIGGDCMIRFGSTNVANMSYLAVYIHFIRVTEGFLEVEGNISIPTVLKKKCTFYGIVNGKRQDCIFHDRGLDKVLGGRVYETRTAFCLVCRLQECTALEIAFGMETEGIQSVCGKINSMRFSPVADVLPHQYAYREGWLLKIEGNRLCCRRTGRDVLRNCEQRFLEQTAELAPEKAAWIRNIRREYFRRKDLKKRQIWLFFDRQDKGDDNGEAMFSYVCSLRRTDLEACFVISRESPDFKRIASIGPVVEALSFEHCVLLLLADYILTSQLNGYVENPFGEYEEYFRDLSHTPKVIFLQHGVTKDDQTKWLNRYNQNLHALVVSAQAEMDAFLNRGYFYREDQIWLTGMPRYDRLDSEKKSLSKYILVMPTWRKVFMEQKYDNKTHTYRWMPRDSFSSSRYVGKYHSLLNNKKLQKYCIKYGYKIAFMPHPIVMPYREIFQADSSVETFPLHTSWGELFSRGSLLVTDYSSVAFDFAFLKKPVVYYQFDRKDFFASHSYAKGYFKYKKMGFGEVVKEEEKLVSLLGKYMKNGCAMGRIYRERVGRFFAHPKGGSCERIFRKIMEKDIVTEEQRDDRAESEVQV